MPRGFSRYDEAALQGRLWFPRAGDPTATSFWLDTADKPSISRSDANVLKTFDKSGNGNDLIPNSGNPVFSDRALGGIAPGITFPSASNGLRRTSGVTLPNPVCVLMVGQVANTSEVRLASLLSTPVGGSDYNYLIPIIFNSQQIRAFGNNGFQGTSGVVTINRPFIAASLFSPTQSICDLNGVPGTAASMPYPTQLPTGIGIGIGAGGEAGGSGHTISEVQFVPWFLLQNQRLRDLYTGSLVWKWAAKLGSYSLLADLGPTHRFRNRPPLIGD